MSEQIGSDDTDFSRELRQRIAEAQASLHEAHVAGDDYAVQLSVGQIESFTRLAVDHQVVLDDQDRIEASLAPYRLA